MGGGEQSFSHRADCLKKNQSAYVSGKRRENSVQMSACLREAFLLPEEQVKPSSLGCKANGSSPITAG